MGHGYYPKRKYVCLIKSDTVRDIKRLLKIYSAIEVANLPEYKDTLTLASIWDIAIGKIYKKVTID